MLDAALGILITRQGSKPSTVIRPLSKNVRQALYKRLAGSGMIRAGRGRTLGIFPSAPRRSKTPAMRSRSASW